MAASPRPLVLLADDDASVLAVMEHHLNAWGCRVATALDKSQALAALHREEPDLVLLDQRFGEHDGVEFMQDLLRSRPGLAVVMLTAFGTIDQAVAAMKLGAYDYLTKPPDLHRLRVLLDHAVEQQRLRRRVRRLEHLVEPENPADRIWGESPAIRQVRDLVARVAATSATVLVLGESGTGKELVAHALHGLSARRAGPFVPVNMAALPRDLVESTLFGHERAAFTGADQARAGLCETADGGTLFLDEIGEMDLSLQAKLLRFLEERTVQRVGAATARPVNVRVVAATNRDLARRAAAGQFREDLFYRLNVVPVTLPPLRDRRDDIGLLAARFLQRAAARHDRDVTAFSDRVLAAFAAFDWPGNVRQLHNVVERLAILSPTSEIGPELLPPEVLEALASPSPASPTLAPSPLAPSSPAAPLPAAPLPATPSVPVQSLEEMERRAILAALDSAGGNVRKAATLLGLAHATVYRKIKRYAIPTDNRPARVAAG